MSTTQSTQQQRERVPWQGLDGDTEGEKVEAWFERDVWHDPLVCSACFARLKTTATDERDDWGREATQTWRTGDAFLGRDVIPKSRIGQRTTRHDDGQVDGVETIDLSTSSYHVVPRTTCGECGSVGGQYQATLSEGEAVDRVPALVARLEELGHAVATERVYSAVRSLKSDPERTSDDKRVFATAAALGVEHG